MARLASIEGGTRIDPAEFMATHLGTGISRHVLSTAPHDVLALVESLLSPPLVLQIVNVGSNVGVDESLPREALDASADYRMVSWRPATVNSLAARRSGERVSAKGKLETVRRSSLVD